MKKFTRTKLNETKNTKTLKNPSEQSSLGLEGFKAKIQYQKTNKPDQSDTKS